MLRTARFSSITNKNQPDLERSELIFCWYSPTTLAGTGFEPHDLRVMSPTSYQTALPRDIRFRREMPDTGFEPVRDFRLTGF